MYHRTNCNPYLSQPNLMPKNETRHEPEKNTPISSPLQRYVLRHDVRYPVPTHPVECIVSYPHFPSPFPPPCMIFTTLCTRLMTITNTPNPATTAARYVFRLLLASLI